MESKQIWNVDGNAIIWNVLEGQIHQDNYEMSGPYCDSIIEYGVAADGSLMLRRSYYFPTLRTIPNDTHATLELIPEPEKLPALLLGGHPVREFPDWFRLDGTLTMQSHTDAGVQIHRQFFPSSDGLCGLEMVQITAHQAVTLLITTPQQLPLGYTLGTKGVYVTSVQHNAPEKICLEAGQTYTYTVCVSAAIGSKTMQMPDATAELEKRYHRIRALCDRSLVLDTGIRELDVMTRFARLRAGESIFETLTGKYHSPGGRRYYAAVWCNDQVEYAGPHFAMTGDQTAIEASCNAYRAYVPYMAENFAPIPSSVIAEGLDIWNGAGDRGDAAMYLYGASLFALYLGDRQVAQQLYKPIGWCAEYCHRQLTMEGIIRSDTDELEKRIPTDGYANLSTSCLCYGGLLTAAKLADALDDHETAALYRLRAGNLGKAIETYFGATLHGMQTYRYSRGFDTLRSWICLPLCVGIENRSTATVDAMLSPYLWTEEGMLSCEISDDNRDRTIWDRSTLYGFKAAFLAGQGDRIMPLLRRYCRKRLLCDRVPYAVEAYPEGDKRHLSAESALFVRVFTEGLLAIQPESLDRFSFVPRLPEEMLHIDLSYLQIAGGCWRLRVERDHWTAWQADRMVAQGKTDGTRVVLQR